jgi:hypothetical protein
LQSFSSNAATRWPVQKSSGWRGQHWMWVDRVWKRPVDKNNASAFRGTEFKKLAQGFISPSSWPLACYWLPHFAFIESFWSSLKYEVVYHQRFATFAEARNAIFNYIETFYNRTRLHSSLAHQSPIAFESQLTTNHTN